MPVDLEPAKLLRSRDLRKSKEASTLIEELNSKIPDRKIHSIRFINSEMRSLEDGLIKKLEELRCVPVRSVYQPFPRIVRDLAKDLGKAVSLTGDSIRIDSTIASVLNNTLIHLIRNSLDHGLEQSEERRKNGKDEVVACSYDPED